MKIQIFEGLDTNVLAQQSTNMSSILAIIVFVICAAVIGWCISIYLENKKMKAEKSKMLDDDGELPFTS